VRSIIDQFSGLPDAGLKADVALEVLIDVQWQRMKMARTDRESQDALTEVMVLMRRRSDTQWMKLEFDRRALMRAA